MRLSHIIIVSLALLLSSCGTSNFNRQKFTDLKGIKQSAKKATTEEQALIEEDSRFNYNSSLEEIETSAEENFQYDPPFQEQPIASNYQDNVIETRNEARPETFDHQKDADPDKEKEKRNNGREGIIALLVIGLIIGALVSSAGVFMSLLITRIYGTIAFIVGNVIAGLCGKALESHGAIRSGKKGFWIFAIIMFSLNPVATFLVFGLINGIIAAVLSALGIVVAVLALRKINATGGGDNFPAIYFWLALVIYSLIGINLFWI